MLHFSRSFKSFSFGEALQSPPKISFLCREKKKMRDWAAPIIALALFAFLSPGVIFQLPGKHRPVDFMNMKTSVVSILVHALMYGLFLMLFLVILRVHLYV
ncbi:uncharacterized protein LOC131246756 [Magnolia sinica]|uniref:uncharacterized protein LOC131246756 n=1 Tax=Magnolia sinica TaxID=86752 RepID=UPI00265AEA46|nr:uncharacterized protein LOC131246756 [Magnolia sinica]XP_058103128.1 uncharacterized protein LOC131246756 [Magnolia sinica]